MKGQSNSINSANIRKPQGNTEKAILEFLEQELPYYALLVRGQWGSGKTYFIKEVLPEITTKEQIYISVNGLTNLSEVGHTAVLKYYLRDKSKWVKTVINIGRGFFKKDQREHFDKEFADFLTEKTPFENQYFVFDDIERLGNGLSTVDLLGYINTHFVEHQNLHVIILSNDAEISPNDKFSKHKEKIIGRTITIQHDKPAIFDAFVSKYDKDFKKFIQNHKGLVIQTFEDAECKNLRSLRFLIEILERIFNRTNTANQQSLSQLSQEVCFFTTVIAIEYREGLIKPEADAGVYRELYTQRQQYQPNQFPAGNEETNERKEITRLRDTFLRDVQYIFFPSIYQYIVAGTPFDEALFIQTLQEKTALGMGNPNNELSKFRSFRDLNDSQLIKVMDSAKGKIASGQLKTTDALYLFSYLEFFNVRLGFELEGLTDLAKRTIDNAGNKNDIQPANDFTVVDDSGLPLSANLKAQLLDLSKANESHSYREDLLSMLSSPDFNDDYAGTIDDFEIPNIFSLVPATELADLVANNPEIYLRNINKFVKEKYSKKSSDKNFRDERADWNDFYKILLTKLDQSTLGNIDRFVLGDLESRLHRILPKGNSAY